MLLDKARYAGGKIYIVYYSVQRCLVPVVLGDASQITSLRYGGRVNLTVFSFPSDYE